MLNFGCHMAIGKITDTRNKGSSNGTQPSNLLEFVFILQCQFVTSLLCCELLGAMVAKNERR
jgi:hypothetical protein